MCQKRKRRGGERNPILQVNNACPSDKMRGRETNFTDYPLQITHYVSRCAFPVSRSWILCVPLVLLTCAAPPLIVPEYGTIAPDFTLKDQNDIEIRLSQFHGENVLLFGFDRDSINHGEPWLTLFLERYADSLRILPIANGSNMPFSARLFLKGKVKAELQDAAEEFNLSNFLLDWTGEVSRQFGMPHQVPTVVLIDTTGRIQWIQSLPQITTDEARAILGKIDKRIK